MPQTGNPPPLSHPKPSPPPGLPPGHIRKYLTSMGINPIIVHDRDNNTPGAFLFNKPIEEALNSNGKIILMEENVEDVLGYSASYEKPFKAFLETEKWGDKWEDLPEKWRLKLIDIFHPYIS